MVRQKEATDNNRLNTFKGWSVHRCANQVLLHFDHLEKNYSTAKYLLNDAHNFVSLSVQVVKPAGSENIPPCLQTFHNTTSTCTHFHGNELKPCVHHKNHGMSITHTYLEHDLMYH